MTNNVNPFTLFFDLANGKSNEKESSKRYVSNMKGIFHNEAALQQVVDEEDRLVYEFYELDLPQTEGNILFGTSIVYPGKVGDEYNMTKGHFHTILDTGEVYYCISGQGLLLMENPEGDWDTGEFKPGNAVYTPGRYAHRSINTGDEPLVTFFAFRADAGHDYGTIETKGFRKLVVERDGKPEVIDNPNWKDN
ncbi:glucose-6-phosphate isomerase [Oceanobacillus jeddahense]|uniref:glucose-6-phosphate isomerase n=1 Tax=Oceanobacillus jeddahense TaxID=1462527 RepID=A0ABY5JPV2_9BACI|nr:glucose-6-phosphate isomerase [Oceanobacillus jeddahense]UUI02325.1 glucose-6-phosphate isomerase [Oceanobacillus jeddahense]